MVSHAFVSAAADGGDATLVRPSNWNATHGITQIQTEPAVSDTILAGASAIVIGLPLILDSGIVLTIASGAVLAVLP